MYKNYKFLNTQDIPITEEIKHERNWDVINVFFSSDSVDNYKQGIEVEESKYIYPCHYFDSRKYPVIYYRGAMNLPLSMYGDITKDKIREVYKERTRIVEKISLKPNWFDKDVLFTNKNKIKIKVEPHSFIEIEIEFDEK